MLIVTSRNLLASESTAAKEKQQPQPSLSSLLTSFLPFSVPTAAISGPRVSSEEEDEQLLSHAPLKEDDPLPMNALFTPLTITSTTHAPTSTPSSHSIKQKHSITLASPGGLLTCKVDMTVASEPGSDMVPTIERLEMCELSSWARSEIGDWADKRCQERDIATLGYGLGRYWDISVKRAQCWIQIQKLFPALTSSTSLPEDQEAANMSKKQLLLHLGRASLELKDAEVVLRIGWRLGFDWTGEVESAVAVETGVPGGCELLFPCLLCCPFHFPRDHIDCAFLAYIAPAYAHIHLSSRLFRTRSTFTLAQSPTSSHERWY
jgi:hypothetical protein